MIQVTYQRKNYQVKVTCHGLSIRAANDEKFDFEGKQVTVQQYFEKMLNIQLKYPSLPCLWVGNKERKNYVPIEVSFSNWHSTCYCWSQLN